MSKRSGSSSTYNTRNKRQRTTSDSASRSRHAGTSATVSQTSASFSAISTRNVRPDSLPSLATICARVFVDNFRELSNLSNWTNVSRWLRIIPNAIAFKIFAMLKDKHPSYLSHAVITTYFMRGDAIDLTGEINVNLETLRAIPRVSGSTLRILRLENLLPPKFEDSVVANAVNLLPSLEVLHLRNCSAVGTKTVEAAARSCLHLKSVNFSYTSVTPSSIHILLDARSELEVLKLAGVQTFSDATVHKSLAFFTHADASPFRKLRTLKLRENNLTESTIIPIISQCPSLERLDLSFTLLRHFPHLNVYPPLEKLTLTSTIVPMTDLIETVQNLPKLKTLNIGAMGFKSGRTSVANPANIAAMLLDDKALTLLTDALENCPEIESINLVRNAKLGKSWPPHSEGLGYFIKKIGRKCKFLNLSGIPNLRTSDLAGFIPDPGMSVSPLQTIILNRTEIGVHEYGHQPLASCTNLEVLEVAETKMTAESLFPIIDACPRLHKLNVTGCRGIKIVDRRRFFEVWEEQREE